MNKFLFVFKALYKGKSITRSFLELRLREEMLHGKILDLGAGKNDLYSNFIPQSQGSSYNLLDAKLGSSIDFETDNLPFEENMFDNIVLLNVLEHIYNYKNLITEIKRIKKNDGRLVGFVPFLMWYHKDPHDYFRYTNEALERIFSDIGFQSIKIEPIFFGPYTTALQMVYPTLPKILRPLVFTVVYLMDKFFIYFRRESSSRYALGYYFTVI